jgi:hypothetical protein
VIPITEDCGVWHPQEGVFNGHFQPTEAQKVKRIGNLRLGVVKVLEDEKYTPSIDKKYKVADMITGFGVSESVKHYYTLYNDQISGKRAIIQGWGNVASAAAYYLSKLGVKIVGIIDRNGGLINPDGYSEAEIHALFLNKQGNTLVANGMLSKEEVESVLKDCLSGDYNHVLTVLMDHTK